jgi:hypothetical protein
MLAPGLDISNNPSQLSIHLPDCFKVEDGIYGQVALNGNKQHGYIGYFGGKSCKDVDPEARMETDKYLSFCFHKYLVVELLVVYSIMYVEETACRKYGMVQE